MFVEIGRSSLLLRGKNDRRGIRSCGVSFGHTRDLKRLKQNVRSPVSFDDSDHFTSRQNVARFALGGCIVDVFFLDSAIFVDSGTVLIVIRIVILESD